MTLFEYEDQNPPNLRLHSGVPFRGSVIGHCGYDESRDEGVAVFPRTRDEHYFRKYDGYAISEEVLASLSVDTIYVVERDCKNNLLEFDPATFDNGERIAYSAREDTIVESADAIEALGHEFDDCQRIARTHDARRLWPRELCTIRRVQ